MNRNWIKHRHLGAIIECNCLWGCICIFSYFSPTKSKINLRIVDIRHQPLRSMASVTTTPHCQVLGHYRYACGTNTNVNTEHKFPHDRTSLHVTWYMQACMENAIVCHGTNTVAQRLCVIGQQPYVFIFQL
jgi:hypothetical protein